MLNADQWVKRQAQLDAARAERRGVQAIGSVWPTPDDSGFGITPLEIAPGRGDLNYMAGSLPTMPTGLQLVGPYVISFARIFMSQPWVAAAVMRMLTWAARVPLNVYRKDTGDPNNATRVLPDEHPLAAALQNPWYRGSQLELVHAMLGPVLVHGHSVIEMQNGANNAIQFEPHDWRFCRPIMPFRSELDGFMFDFDQPALKKRVDISEVLFTRWWSPIAPMGCSPLQQLGVTLQIEDAAQRIQRGSFNNANRTGGVVTMGPEYLGYDLQERLKIAAFLRQDVTDLHVGPENSGRPMLLPPGLDWKPSQATMVEAALIDQKKLTREEIASVYMIPPPLIGILDRATYSNIETQRDMVYTDIVGPPLVMLEQTMNAQLVREVLADEEIYVAFDFAAVLRGDRLAEIEQVRNAIGMGLMNPNEGRAVIGLPRKNLAGMDEFYMPLVNNLAPVGTPAVSGGVNSPPGSPSNDQQGPFDAPGNAPEDFPGKRGQNGQPSPRSFLELAKLAGFVPNGE